MMGFASLQVLFSYNKRSMQNDSHRQGKGAHAVCLLGKWQLAVAEQLVQPQNSKQFLRIFRALREAQAL